jgi:hypothetical protein
MAVVSTVVILLLLGAGVGARGARCGGADVGDDDRVGPIVEAAEEAGEAAQLVEVEVGDDLVHGERALRVETLELVGAERRGLDESRAAVLRVGAGADEAGLVEGGDAPAHGGARHPAQVRELAGAQRTALRDHPEQHASGGVEPSAGLVLTDRLHGVARPDAVELHAQGPLQGGAIVGHGNSIVALCNQ